MRIRLFSEVTLFKYNVSTILSPIVGKSELSQYPCGELARTPLILTASQPTWQHSNQLNQVSVPSFKTWFWPKCLFCRAEKWWKICWPAADKSIQSHARKGPLVPRVTTGYGNTNPFFVTEHNALESVAGILCTAGGEAARNFKSTFPIPLPV